MGLVVREDEDMNLANLFRPPPLDPILQVVSGVAIFRECTRGSWRL